MATTGDVNPHLGSGHYHRTEMFREATIMILYVCVVEIAELAAVPEHHLPGHDVTGPVGAELLASVGNGPWAPLAHWFAFGLAARGFRGDRATHHDTQIALAQVAGAVFVAAISSVPVLIFNETRSQEGVGYMPALLIGVAGQLLAARCGRSRSASVFYGLTALSLGVVIALVKNGLAGH